MAQVVGTTSKLLADQAHAKFPSLEVGSVDGGDLYFAPRGGPDTVAILHDVVAIGDRAVAA